jgi:hypothetical protein
VRVKPTAVPADSVTAALAGDSASAASGKAP